MPAQIADNVPRLTLSTGVAAFVRNRWPLCLGLGGRFPSESLATLPRNPHQPEDTTNARAPLLGGTIAAWPRLASGQKQIPAIGFLHQGFPESALLMNAFRKGLSQAGIIEGQSVTIEDRVANGHYDRLPALAADLVEHRVAVIAANFLPAALAAKAATQTIPIVFLTRGIDRVGPLSPFVLWGLTTRGMCAKGANRSPKQCVILDLESADHIIALNELEHRPIMSERFPGWESRIQYWGIGDVAFVQPNMALALIEAQVERLLASFRDRQSEK